MQAASSRPRAHPPECLARAGANRRQAPRANFPCTNRGLIRSDYSRGALPAMSSTPPQMLQM